MFDFAFDSYMTHGFPADEVNPVTCEPKSRDADENNWSTNDILGGFALTLIDSLDSLGNF